jgi:hypothetical protein
MFRFRQRADAFAQRPGGLAKWRAQCFRVMSFISFSFRRKDERHFAKPLVMRSQINPTSQSRRTRQHFRFFYLLRLRALTLSLYLPTHTQTDILHSIPFTAPTHLFPISLNMVTCKRLTFVSIPVCGDNLVLSTLNYHQSTTQI